MLPKFHENTARTSTCCFQKSLKFVQYFPQVILKFIGKSQKIISFFKILVFFYFQQCFHCFPEISPNIFRNVFKITSYFLKNFPENYTKFLLKWVETLFKMFFSISSKLLPNFFEYF